MGGAQGSRTARCTAFAVYLYTCAQNTSKILAPPLYSMYRYTTSEYVVSHVIYIVYEPLPIIDWQRFYLERTQKLSLAADRTLEANCESSSFRRIR